MKHLLYILSVLLIFGCSKKEDEEAVALAVEPYISFVSLSSYEIENFKNSDTLTVAVKSFFPKNS